MQRSGATVRWVQGGRKHQPGLRVAWCARQGHAGSTPTACPAHSPRPPPPPLPHPASTTSSPRPSRPSSASYSGAAGPMHACQGRATTAGHPRGDCAMCGAAGQAEAKGWASFVRPFLPAHCTAYCTAHCTPCLPQLHRGRRPVALAAARLQGVHRRCDPPPHQAPVARHLWQALPIPSRWLPARPSPGHPDTHTPPVPCRPGQPATGVRCHQEPRHL